MQTARALPRDTLDLLVQWPLRLGGGAFSSGIDNATGTVRVTGSGAWHQPDAARYFDQQRRIVEVARRRFGALRVFFDTRGWIVENEQSVLQFEAMNLELYRPQDRLAALVGSSLLKKHPRTALAVGQRESFLSERAAETWLQAYAAND